MAAGAGFLYLPPVSPDSRFGSHSEKCSGSIRGPSLLEYQLPPPQPLLAKGSVRGQLLRPPSHLLRQSVIYSVPQFVTSLKKLDPVARVLSDSLRSVCVSNSEEAWLKLFMLPKCVLRASLQGGHKHKSHSIEELCRLWSDGHLASLWQYASDHARKPNSKPSKEKAKSKVQSAVYKAREGVLGKACKVLTSSGIAPNTPETWHLLQQKHPKGPVSSCPEVTLPSEGFRLPPDLKSCRSFNNFLETVLVAPQVCEYSTSSMLPKSTWQPPSVLHSGLW